MPDIIYYHYVHHSELLLLGNYKSETLEIVTSTSLWNW
jgi:hypothetical protein